MRATSSRRFLCVASGGRQRLSHNTTAASSYVETALRSPNRIGRIGSFAVPLSTAAAKPAPSGPIPDTIKRVGVTDVFPDEYPGHMYAFNWCLNGDGVTPLRKSSFRITKPLDLKIAGLKQPKQSPLKIDPAAESAIFEAGSDQLSFDAFDEVCQRTRDLLSLSDHLYCPEGHIPGTHTAARIITNSATLAPDILAYLERAPRKEPPTSLPITAYVFEGTQEGFAGYAIEEIEVLVPPKDDGLGYMTGDIPDPPLVPTSVASVVVVGETPDLKVLVAGLELCQKALHQDEQERLAKASNASEE